MMRRLVASCRAALLTSVLSACAPEPPLPRVLQTGQRWSAGMISVRVDASDAARLDAPLDKAINWWNAQLGERRFVRISAPWVTLTEAAQIDGPIGVLISGGDISPNQDVVGWESSIMTEGVSRASWIVIVDRAPGRWLTSTLAHELGHSLGLGHVQQDGRLMHPTEAAMSLEGQWLADDEIEWAQSPLSPP